MRSTSLLRVTALAAVTLAAAPALAQDPTVEPFSGLYVAGTIGKVVQTNDGVGAVAFDRNLDGTFGDPVRTATGADAFSTGFCGGRALGPSRGDGCAGDKDGWDYSARVGFDRQFGNIVVGAIGEFGDNNTRDYQTAYSTTLRKLVTAKKSGTWPSV